MKTATIIGMGATLIKCPFEDDSEIWAMNQTYQVAKRIDRLFISDPRLNFRGGENHDYEELNSLGIPIVSLHHFPEIENFEAFPYDEIVEEFGSEFFTNTVCYMVAYAIYKKYDKIRFYGIDMATEMEYRIERGGVEFWVGVAIGRGMKFENTKGSMVCKPIMGVPYGHKFYADMKTVDPYNLLKRNEEEMKNDDSPNLASNHEERADSQHINPVLT